MTKKIRTYKELLEEKERLKAIVKVQREVVNQDFRELGESLEPVRSAVSFAGKLFTRDESNVLLNIGAGTAIDLLIRNVLLSKAGWFTRIVVPFFLKNFSSHFNSNGVVKKIFSWIGKKHANGQERVEEEED